MEFITPIGGGVIAFWAIWVANRRSKAMESNAEAMKDDVKQTETGHRQERFRDAVTHLGNEKASVRLGGAYALFHLAREDQDRRIGIAEILCAHIRETTQKPEYQKEYKEQPSTEIQSLLTLLFRRNQEDTKNLLQNVQINLEGAWLHGADLKDAQLQGAYLTKAQLQGAWLYQAQLQGAYLENAQLQGAYLKNAQLQGAWLYQAQLQEVTFPLKLSHER